MQAAYVWSDSRITKMEKVHFALLMNFCRQSGRRKIGTWKDYEAKSKVFEEETFNDEGAHDCVAAAVEVNGVAVEDMTETVDEGEAVVVAVDVPESAGGLC